jgi:hypothetical protein
MTKENRQQMKKTSRNTLRRVGDNSGAPRKHVPMTGGERK